MNDRFKFRVWDSSANAYVPRSQFILLSDGTLIQEIGGEEVIWESTQPEFCTGLKDKNGKLIYEGDIVELTQSRNKGWMLRGTRLEVKYNIDRYCGFGFDDGYALTEKCAKNCIVIGNIHTENYND